MPGETKDTKMRYTSNVVIGGKLYTAKFARFGITQICRGEDGERVWDCGWSGTPSKLALRLAQAFNVSLNAPSNDELLAMETAAA